MFVRTCLCVCLCAPDRLDGWMIFLLLSFWMACSCLSILQPACLLCSLSTWIIDWLTISAILLTGVAVFLSAILSVAELNLNDLLWCSNQKLISCLHLLWLSSLQRSLLSYCDINLLSPCSVCDDWRIHTINYCQINGYFLFSFWAY